MFYTATPTADGQVILQALPHGTNPADLPNWFNMTQKQPQQPQLYNQSQFNTGLKPQPSIAPNSNNSQADSIQELQKRLAEETRRKNLLESQLKEKERQQQQLKTSKSPLKLSPKTTANISSAHWSRLSGNGTVATTW